MNKEANLQFELFSGADNSPQAALRKKNPSFLKRIRNYERMMLLIIAIAATAIISFSFGVEKGKKLSLLQNNARFDLGLQTGPALPRQAVGPVREPRLDGVKQETSAIVQPRIINDHANTPAPLQKTTPAKMRGFTIQLASYKTKSYVEKEAQALKKKGLTPLILTKGSYKVLCVGTFTSKESAQTLLAQLARMYDGCRIRRL